jgi:hypothetical protein
MAVITPEPYMCRSLDPSNPYYPLPRDYGDLTEEGRRQARVATVCKQNTPMEFVQAWDLFRRLYLMPTEPGFFYHGFKESPPFHYDAVYDLGTYGRNILAAPRGTAKSVVMGTEIPAFLLLTRKYIRIVLSLATDRMIEERFDTLINQFTQNPFILQDFGRIKPTRGQAIWNRHHLQLVNGSKLQGISVMGRKRGARPDLFLLDDPEFDPTSETSATVLREQFEVFLFKQVIPMLEEGSSLFWIGTMIGRRSFLAHSCYGDDPRFEFWNRKVLQAIRYENGKAELLWDGKWTKETLEARRKEIGNAAFSTEYLNQPASADERAFVIDERKNEYELDGPIIGQPHSSDTHITFYKYDRNDHEWKAHTKTMAEFLKNMFIVVTSDLAQGLQQHNDYSCFAVLGYDQDNCLWVLDMWMGRAKREKLLRELFGLAQKWKAKVIGIESCSTQIEFVEAAEEFLERHIRSKGAETDPHAVWRPRVMPVNYKNVKGPKGKADRIMTLEWRYQAGKIKYPRHLENKWPFSMLYSQTRDFTYDLAMLAWDDAIDAVAQGSYVVHGRGVKVTEEKRDETIADKIRKGKVKENGLPVLSGLSSEKITPEIMNALLDRSKAIQYDKRSARERKPYMGKTRRFRERKR